MKEIFTPDMKLSDMIDIDYNMLQVISRVGLSLKDAGLTISEACSSRGIDPATFILVCNVYSFSEYVPTPSEIDACSIPDIVRYLHGSHAYYTGWALGSLEESFNCLVAPCDGRQKEVIMKFFIDYKSELLKHFAREEERVFPYIEALLSGRKAEDYSIDEFEEHHENIDEKLVDMKNIVMKYLPAECDEQTKMVVLLSIYHLHDDLHRHTYVEDNILVPIVRKLESDGR